MDLKKFAPWNWFKKEESQTGFHVPVQHNEAQPSYPEANLMHPVSHLQRQMNQIFDDVIQGFGGSLLNRGPFTSLPDFRILKPKVDIGATDEEYAITVEVPGVSENEVKVEIKDNTLTIQGEKKREREEKKRNYYCVERSYGSFQRTLDLPDDAIEEDIRAVFKKGVLTIRIPRKELPRSEIRQIEVQSRE